MKLSPADQGAIAKRYTENPEAYQLFLKSIFYWNKRTRADMAKSIDYFNQAIERDPNYSLAYAGLADSWYLSGWYRWESAENAFPRAKSAATRALALDPNYSFGYSHDGRTLAFARAIHTRDAVLISEVK